MCRVSSWSGALLWDRLVRQVYATLRSFRTHVQNNTGLFRGGPAAAEKPKVNARDLDAAMRERNNGDMPIPKEKS